MSGGNPVKKLNPVNLIQPLLLGAGGSMLFSSIKKNATPTMPQNPGTPPSISPPPTPTDANPELTAQQRSRKLRALQYGFASTITSRSNGLGQAMMSSGGKQFLGQ